MNSLGIFFHTVLTVIVLLTSCSKRNQLQYAYAPEENEVVKLLTNKYWQETLVSVDSSQQEVTSHFPLPDRDDLIYFSKDGTYRFEESALKHKAINTYVFLEGTWNYDKNTSTLILNADDSTTKYELLKISETDLVLKLSVVNERKSYSYRLEYKAR